MDGGAGRALVLVGVPGVLGARTATHAAVAPGRVRRRVAVPEIRCRPGSDNVDDDHDDDHDHDATAAAAAAPSAAADAVDGGSRRSDGAGTGGGPSRSPASSELQQQQLQVAAGQQQRGRRRGRQRRRGLVGGGRERRRGQRRRRRRRSDIVVERQQAAIRPKRPALVQHGPRTVRCRGAAVSWRHPLGTSRNDAKRRVVYTCFQTVSDRMPTPAITS